MSRMQTPGNFVNSRDFARVARAIAYIDANFRSQPRLASIAAAAQLSEFHFNRLFRRWAGLTPHQYLAFVTANAARAALRAAPSVLEAAYAVGLSGPGRLHDLIVTLEAVTPGEWKARGAGVELVYGLSTTPFGQALFATTPRGLAHLSFVEHAAEPAALAALADGWPRAQLVRDDAAARALALRVFGPAAGKGALKLAVRGTNFQVKVWQALLDMAGTRTTTYAELAAAAGVAGGARAVGNAVGTNPVAWLIPCHTVLRKDGELGGYRWGSARKRAMLAWQSVHQAHGAPGRAGMGPARALAQAT
jgi:AraC family transcriptional regulator, regulatory protein of adaptative response / methylated-DNA-[protein]-cysteine methyltransferase